MTPTIGEDKPLDDFCDFLSAEWGGTRRHSYLVPIEENRRPGRNRCPTVSGPR